jgi:HAD superfamily hydrolase (TIGR01458 family)
MDWPDGIRGALVDIDGTLTVGDRAVPGAAEALRRLREREITFRLATNTSRRSRAEIAAALQRAGIAAGEEEVVVPALLARRRMIASGRTRAMLLVPGTCRVDFDGIDVDDARPDWVVVGDIGSAFTWDRLNQAFWGLRGGASLIALHKNRFWDPGDGRFVLDAGPFVAALEYAAGTTAELVGKPARSFFELALEELGLAAAEVLVVGDDPETDGAGGAAVGCRTALVRTGKFDREALDRTVTRPDLILDSVADLLA